MESLLSITCGAFGQQKAREVSADVASRFKDFMMTGSRSATAR